MKVTTQCHLRALKTQKRIITANLSAVVADVIWISHDISINGLGGTYLLIGLLLIVALGANILAAWGNHMKEKYELQQKIYVEKLAKATARRRHSNHKKGR